MSWECERPPGREVAHSGECDRHVGYLKGQVWGRRRHVRAWREMIGVRWAAWSHGSYGGRWKNGNEMRSFGSCTTRWKMGSTAPAVKRVKISPAKTTISPGARAGSSSYLPSALRLRALAPHEAAVLDANRGDAGGRAGAMDVAEQSATTQVG